MEQMIPPGLPALCFWGGNKIKKKRKEGKKVKRGLNANRSMKTEEFGKLQGGSGSCHTAAALEQGAELLGQHLLLALLFLTRAPRMERKQLPHARNWDCKPCPSGMPPCSKPARAELLPALMLPLTLSASQKNHWDPIKFPLFPIEKQILT